MLSKTMEKALNKQVNAEAYSAYLYKSMSANFTAQGLRGAAHWLHVQMQEELIHAMKFYDFILERNGKVTLTAIDGPPTEWATPLAAFENAYAHEQKVTGMINSLVNLALKEGDHATNSFLKWFVDEQVEEEASASAVVQQLELVGDNRSALFLVDRELGQRVFVPPPAAGAAEAAQP